MMISTISGLQQSQILIQQQKKRRSDDPSIDYLTDIELKLYTVKEDPRLNMHIKTLHQDISRKIIYFSFSALSLIAKCK